MHDFKKLTKPTFVVWTSQDFKVRVAIFEHYDLNDLIVFSGISYCGMWQLLL